MKSPSMMNGRKLAILQTKGNEADSIGAYLFIEMYHTYTTVTTMLRSVDRSVSHSKGLKLA